MAVDILDFSRQQEMPGSHVFNSHDHRRSVYDAAMQELATESSCTSEGQRDTHHYWQENGITVLEARLTNELRKALTANSRKVIPLADNNRPEVQNEEQNVRSLTLGCYTRRGHGVTLASDQEEWSELMRAAHEVARRQPKSIQQAYLAVTITEGSVNTHSDQHNQGDTNLLVVGDFTGGRLVIEQRALYVYTNVGRALIPNEDIPLKRTVGSDVHSRSTRQAMWRNSLG
eukprot:2950481-Amphidinium_carterae.9